MACNLAPVGRIEFTGQQSPRFGIPELDAKLDASAPSYDWHSMVHGDAFPGTAKRLRPDGANQTLGYDDLLVKSYAFFVKQFADLMTELDSHPEDGGTVLDHTMLVLASDLGESLGHNHAKMGFILAGNLGGAKRNFHFRASAPGATPLGNFYQRSNFQVIQLLNSIADMAGKTGESVGLQGYLTSEGAPRRIDGVF
jgi:hypothetical protein